MFNPINASSDGAAEALWSVEPRLESSDSSSVDFASMAVSSFKAFDPPICLAKAPMPASQSFSPKTSSSAGWILAQGLWALLIKDSRVYQGLLDMARWWLNGYETASYFYEGLRTQPPVLRPNPKPNLRLVPSVAEPAPARLRVIQGGLSSQSVPLLKSQVGVCEAPANEVGIIREVARNSRPARPLAMRAPALRLGPVLGLGAFIRSTVLGALVFETGKAVGSLPGIKPPSEQVCEMSAQQKKQMMEWAKQYEKTHPIEPLMTPRFKN